MYNEFVTALQSTNLVELTFISKQKGEITRKCAPMDFGPWRRHSSNNDIRYHFIDLDSASGSHPLSITPEQIINIEQIEEKFSPENLISWKPNWYIARNWGKYS
jgi:hypothetical protein